MQRIVLRYFIFANYSLMGASVIAYKKMAVAVSYFKVDKLINFLIHFFCPI